VRLEDPYLPLQRQGKGYPTPSISQTAIPWKQTFSQSSLLPIPRISLVLIILIHKAVKTILEYFLFCCLSHNIITEETEAEHATTTSECNANSDACMFVLCWSGKRRNWRLQFAERRGGIAVVDPL
jgi:hypothetical protein